MKLKLIVSSLFALGVIERAPVGLRGGKGLDLRHGAGRCGLSEGRRQPRQSELLVAHANQQGQHQESRRGVEARRVRGADDQAGGGAGNDHHGPANLAAGHRRRDLLRYARRRRHRHQRQDRYREVEVDAVDRRQRLHVRAARVVASRWVTARSLRSPPATASWRSTRTRATSSGSCSPPAAGGASLGNVAKVGTVYWDGMVYIGTNDASRNAGLAVQVERRRTRMVFLRRRRYRALWSRMSTA